MDDKNDYGDNDCYYPDTINMDINKSVERSSQLVVAQLQELSLKTAALSEHSHY